MYPFTFHRSRLFRFVLLLAALLLPAAALAEGEAAYDYTHIQAGHSAMWYTPARNGEGWMLEILPDDGATLYWFTFDDHGNPRWLVGAGTILRSDAGDDLHFEHLYAVHGPRFGPEFNPADAVREDVGRATFRFRDCDSGEIHFDAYERQGRFALTRLTRTMGANGCRPIHGTPGEPVQPYAGQSGSWYDPAFSGQGFSLGWMPNGDAALVWFTFDAQGQPYWMTAVGQPEGEKIVFPELFAVQGGRFADAFDTEAVTRTPWGTLELTLECDTGHATWESTEAGFATGQFDLTKLTKLESPACPWVKPKLTDLYDITVTPLPTLVPINPIPGQHGSSNLIAAHAVANNGTVVGTRRLQDGSHRPVRLRRGESVWQDVNHTLISGPVFVSADGDSVLVNQRWGGGPVITREGVTLPIVGLPSSGQSEVLGTATDFSFVVGQTHMPPGLPKNWTHSVAGGTVELPATDALPGSRAFCVSDDGNVVIGADRGIVLPGHSALAVRWAQRGGQDYLTDALGNRLADPSTCSSDGGTVFGRVHLMTDENGLRYVLPGYFTHHGISGHFGLINPSDEYPFGWQHVVNNMSADGTLGGGAYRSPAMVESLPNGASAWGALIWTQDTGHVLLPEVLQELEHPLDWPSVWVTGVSPDGKYVVLTTGEIFQQRGEGVPSTLRNALLTLVKKQNPQ